MCLGLDSLVTNWRCSQEKTGWGEGETREEELKPRILSGKVPGRVTWVQVLQSLLATEQATPYLG